MPNKSAEHRKQNLCHSKISLSPKIKEQNILPTKIKH